MSSVESFSEPAVNFSEHRASFATPVLSFQQPSEAHRRKEFVKLARLFTCRLDGLTKGRLALLSFCWIAHQQQLAMQAMKLRFGCRVAAARPDFQSLSGCLHSLFRLLRDQKCESQMGVSVTRNYG